MAHDGLEEEVIAIIAKKTKADAAALTLDSTFAELGIDSLEVIDLLFTFEDRFQLDIPDAAVLQMTTVRQVADALRAILAGRAGNVS